MKYILLDAEVWTGDIVALVRNDARKKLIKFNEDFVMHGQVMSEKEALELTNHIDWVTPVDLEPMPE